MSPCHGIVFGQSRSDKNASNFYGLNCKTLLTFQKLEPILDLCTPRVQAIHTDMDKVNASNVHAHGFWTRWLSSSNHQ